MFGLEYFFLNLLLIYELCCYTNGKSFELKSIMSVLNPERILDNLFFCTRQDRHSSLKNGKKRFYIESSSRGFSDKRGRVTIRMKIMSRANATRRINDSTCVSSAIKSIRLSQTKLHFAINLGDFLCSAICIRAERLSNVARLLLCVCVCVSRCTRSKQM